MDEKEQAIFCRCSVDLVSLQTSPIDFASSHAVYAVIDSLLGGGKCAFDRLHSASMFLQKLHDVLHELTKLTNNNNIVLSTMATCFKKM